MLSVLREFARNFLFLPSVSKTAERLGLLSSKWTPMKYKNVAYLGFGSSTLGTAYWVNKKEVRSAFEDNIKEFNNVIWIVAGACLLRIRKYPTGVLAVLAVSPKGDICDSISLSSSASRAEGSRMPVMHDQDYREKFAPPMPKPMSSKASAPSSSVSTTKNTVHLSKFNGPIYNAIYDCKVNRLYELPEGNLSNKFEMEMAEKVDAISALMNDEKVNKEAIRRALYKLKNKQIPEKDVARTMRFVKASESYLNTCQKLQKDALEYFNQH